MSSQTWNQNRTPLVNRYIDAIHNCASPPPSIMETSRETSSGSNTIETNGRPRNSGTPTRRKDTQQDSAGRSNSPKMKKLGARPTPEELVYSQGQGSQRFQSQSARPSTAPSSFSFGSPRGTFDTVSTAVSGVNTPTRSPIRLRDSTAGIPSTFQVIPQINSIDSTDIDWEDDFSSASYVENAPEATRSAHVDSNFPSQGQNLGVRRLSNDYYGAQQNHIPEENNNGSENEVDNHPSSISRSIKDRIKSFQKCGTPKSEIPLVAPIAPVTSNGEHDHNDNEDKENGENWINNGIKKISTTTFGAISQGPNMSTFRNGSGMKSVAPPPTPAVTPVSSQGNNMNTFRKSLASPTTPAATPISSSKKPAVTASFLVAINKYSPRQQQEKSETHSSQNSNQTLRATSPLGMKDEKKKNICFTSKHQAALGECVEPKRFLPKQGASSTLIASWRQREASNVVSTLPKAHSSCKKVANVALLSIPVLQNKFVEYDTHSEVGNSENSLKAPPVIKSMKNISTASLKSLSDAQLDTLSNIIDQQVEARLLHLECQMEKDFRDKLEKMEARMNIKIGEMMNLIQAQK